MARRPDLDSLVVPKGAQHEALPAAAAETGLAKAYAHTLSLRLSADQYRRLRRFVAEQEEKTGKRITHQGVIEAALDEHLTRMGG